MAVIEERSIARGIIATVLAAATLVALGLSMWLNYLFGFSLGSTTERARIFGCFSVVADVWKACGLIAVIGLWSARWRSLATAGFVVWTACLMYAITSALGFAAEDRMAVVGGREAWAATYQEASRELHGLQQRRETLVSHRSVGEVEAAIAGRLSQPVLVGERVRGTVGSASNECRKPDQRTSQTCAAVAALREELAVAIEAARLDERVVELHRHVADARRQGGVTPPNPQAELIAWLSRGALSVKNISFALMLLLGGVIETLSAFGPAVVFGFLQVSGVTRSRMQDGPRRSTPQRGIAGLSRGELVEHEPVGPVLDYLTECTEPTGETAAIGIDELHSDYERWCKAKEVSVATESAFVTEFDRLRSQPELAGVRKFGERYYGIRLTSRKSRRGTGRIGSK